MAFAGEPLPDLAALNAAYQKAVAENAGVDEAKKAYDEAYAKVLARAAANLGSLSVAFMVTRSERPSAATSTAFDTSSRPIPGLSMLRAVRVATESSETSLRLVAASRSWSVPC